MKQSILNNCWMATLLGLVLGATHLQAQNIARGRAFLKVEAYSEAYDEFLKETQLKPQDPEAQTLAGLANFVNIIRSDSFNDFLDRIGFDKNGRDLGDWTSAMDTEAMKERLKSEKMNGQELSDFIQNELISNLEKSLNHFKAIPTGKSFLIFLSEQETQISDVYLDQGDVSMIQALIELICFTLNGVSTQDMHVDIQSILNLLDDKISADSFMSLNPDFMKNISKNNLKAARASFIGFIDHYMAGSERLKNRSTKHLNHLVSIDEEQEELEADFREHLSHLRFEESLNSLFQIKIKENTFTVSADPVRLFETPIRSLTRVDGLVGVIHQEAEQMATQLDRDIPKLSNISRARIIQPDIDSEGRMPDGADILLLQGDIQLARALSATLSAHDLDIGVQEIIKLRNQEKLDVQNILRTKPALLDLKTPSVMPRVRDWLANARQNLKGGYTLFQSRRKGKVGIIIPDVSALDEIIGTLDTILSSETKAHELSGTFVDGNYLINPNRLWDGKVNIGNLLPSFNANNPMPGTLPDSTMAELFPDGIFFNTHTRLEKFRVPYIVEQPKNTSALLGEEVTFSLKVSGPGTLEYQWYKNGQVIPEANGPSLVIQNVQEEDYDIYSAWVKNSAGKTYSIIAKLEVKTYPPLITLQPKSIERNLGDTGVFSILATGNKPLRYQWYKNGKAIKGATEPTLTITNISEDDITIYSVNVNNDFGKAISETAQLNRKVKLKWVYRAEDKLPSDPAIDDDGTVYIGSVDGKLHAIDGETGKKKWDLQTEGQITNHITIGSNEYVYFTSWTYSEDEILTGNKIVAVDPESKKIKWDYHLDSSKDNAIIGSFTLGRNSNLFITTDPKHEGGWLVSPKLIELNGDKGILNWDMDLNQKINSSSAMDYNGIIYSTTNGNFSYALDTKDQSIVWSINTGAQNNAETIMDLSNIYTTISHEYNFDLNAWNPIDQLIAISSKDGQSLWKLNLPEPVFGMSLGPNGNLVFGIYPEYNRETNQWDSQPKLYSVNRTTGEIQWVKKVQGAINISPAISQDNTVYVGTRGIWDEENGDGEIILHPKFYAIDGDNGKTKWAFNGGGSFFSSPAIAKDGTVIVGSNGTESTGWKVYAFEGTSPLADSAWPMKGQNPKRTFNTTDYITRKYIIITIPDKTASPFTISFTTTEGSTYVFQASSDLKNWSKVEEVNGTGGEVKVTDWREAIFQKQYYRVKLVE